MKKEEIKKILFVFGTRPEAIKLAPLIHKAKQEKKNFHVKVCVTAQHRQMLDQVLDFFGIEPDYDWNIMKESQSLFEITVSELKRFEKLIQNEGPDMILTQGDTTTAFSASLAAYYSKIKIGHVEAGLRTNDKFNPFPEEINRRLTDCLADLYFAPTEKARGNLLREGIKKEKIFVTGNTVIDALLMTVKKQRNRRTQENIKKKFLIDHGILFDNRKLILVTAHRRESFGHGIKNICLALKKIAQSTPDGQIVWPVHLNPSVQNPAKKILKNIDNVHLINPSDYFSFVWLMNRAYLILTDSGGIQEEAPSLGKPVLVMRDNTERPEGIKAGTAKLVGTTSEKIFSETLKLWKDTETYQSMAKAVNPYGDGKASDRIVSIIERELEKK